MDRRLGFHQRNNKLERPKLHDSIGLGAKRLNFRTVQYKARQKLMDSDPVSWLCFASL